MDECNTPTFFFFQKINNMCLMPSLFPTPPPPPPFKVWFLAIMRRFL